MRQRVHSKHFIFDDDHFFHNDYIILFCEFPKLFVMREYRKGNEKIEEGKLVILIARLLTFIMTLIQIFD